MDRPQPSLGVLYILFGLGVSGAWGVFQPGRLFDGILVGTVVMVAGLVAMKAPRHLVSILIVVLAFNRGVRRVLDWSVGEFSTTPITSLTPQLLMLLMGGLALQSWGQLPVWARRAALLYMGAVTYGLAMGVLSHGLGAIYSSFTWVAPFLVFLYVVWLRPSRAVLRQWMVVLVVCALVATTYGWVQYLTLPAWDRFWMISARMNSMGNPEPMKCRFFGPAGTPGGLARLCTFGMVFLLFGLGRGQVLTAPLVGYLAIGLLMTQGRSVLVGTVLIVVFTLLLMRGSSSWKSGLVVLVLVVGIVVVLPSIPGGESVSNRVRTLLNVQEDGSFRGRMTFTRYALPEILMQPQGSGIGAAGLGRRVTGVYSISAFDNGYLAVLFSLGLPGLAMLVGSLALIARHTAMARFSPDADSRLIALGRGLCIGYLFLMLPSNWLDDDITFLLWMIVGVLAVMASPVSGEAVRGGVVRRGVGVDPRAYGPGVSGRDTARGVPGRLLGGGMEGAGPAAGPR
ncbi:MAG: O-antigen ligase family protein [Planctomycetota bacterium]